jgi:hypothetical protein
MNTKKEIQANHNHQKHMVAYHRTSEIWEGKFKQTKRTSKCVRTESLYMRVKQLQTQNLGLDSRFSAQRQWRLGMKITSPA